MSFDRYGGEQMKRLGLTTEMTQLFSLMTAFFSISCEGARTSKLALVVLLAFNKATQ